VLHSHEAVYADDMPRQKLHEHVHIAFRGEIVAQDAAEKREAAEVMAPAEILDEFPRYVHGRGFHTRSFPRSRDFDPNTSCLVNVSSVQRLGKCVPFCPEDRMTSVRILGFAIVLLVPIIVFEFLVLIGYLPARRRTATDWLEDKQVHRRTQYLRRAWSIVVIIAASAALVWCWRTFHNWTAVG